MKFYQCVFFSLICIPFFGFASVNFKHNSSEDTIKRNQLLAYPIVFFLPETKWGFGAAGLYNFRFKNESKDSNPSQIQFAASYTQNKQIILTFPFELYFNENIWKLKGEIAFYKYSYKYYGVGIHSKENDKEFFLARYPRVKADFLKRFDKTFVGVRFRYDNMSIIEKGNLLESSGNTGKDGGVNTGVGFITQWDIRDFIYNPSKGTYLEAELYFSGKFIGSDFNYQRFALDVSRYFRIANNHTMAVQLYNATIQGDPIFYEMLFFGSPRLLRGYQDRRFIDKNILVSQYEYRFPLYKRIQGVSFLSFGTVAASYAALYSNPYKYSYGAGLRFVLNKKDRIRLRLDYGQSKDEGGSMYLTINEAF